MTTIAVGVDDSPHADLAVRWAVQEARLRRAGLELIHAYVMYFRRTETVSSHELAEPVMDRIVERNRDVLDTVKWTTTLVPVTGAAFSAALARAGHDADLLVVGSRGRGGFGALLLGSTSYRTAGRAPCPVVVVRGDPEAASPADVRRIVVGVDGSRPARRALRWALDEARMRDLPVTVVHGYPEPAFLMHAGLQSDANLQHARTTARERAVAVIDGTLEAVEPPSGIQIDRMAATGPAAGLLLEHAGADALLVVGTRGHGAVGQMLVGSVTHQCLHHATGSVAVVP